MLITSVLLIFTGIVSTQDTPIPSTNVSYYQPTQAPDQSASPSNTSRDWAKHQFVAYITLGVIGIVIVGISVPCFIAWCSGDLKKLEDYCKRRRTRQSGVGNTTYASTDYCKIRRTRQSGGEDTTDAPTALEMAEIHQVPKKRKPKLEDPFKEEHFEPVISKLDVNSLNRLFCVLEGLTHPQIQQILRPKFALLSTPDLTRNVLMAWVAAAGVDPDTKVSKATRREICNALGKSGKKNAKELLENHWAGKLDQVCEAKDANDILIYGKLQWSGFQKMCLNGLGLEYNYIEMVKGVQDSTAESSAMEVFLAWIDTEPKPTIKDLMIALKEIQNLRNAQLLAGDWDIPLKDIEQLKKAK